MSLVATFVSNPMTPAVTGAFLEEIQALLPGSGDPRILNSGIAAEFACSADDRAGLTEQLNAALCERPIDVFVQKAEGRRKLLLIADMDSTMIRQECIDELAAELGLKDQISEITERAMRGEMEFDPALRERVGLLAGLPVSSIGKVLSERIQLMPGGRTLVQTMKANGAYCALVSGGFTHFTSAIATLLGFDENQANLLLERDGKLSGKVQEPILGRDAKRQRLEELVSEKGLAFSDALAVGDGANDLAMIERAGLGVAYRAKPAVAAAADLSVKHGDLTALLYMQGYALNDFNLG